MPLFKRKGNNESVGNKSKLKILFTSDVHGSETAFRKFLNAGVIHEVDALIIGGDLAGKRLVPIIEEGNTYYMNGKEYNSSALNRLLEEFRREGTYYVFLTKGEYSDVIEDKNKQDKIFDGVMAETLRRWISIAEEKIRGKIPIYVNLGNDDPNFLFDVIEGSDVMRKSEGNIVVLGDHEMISFGYVNPTPWKTPREMIEDEMYESLAREIEKIERIERAIFNFHAPPFNTSLDLAPQLTPDLKPVVRGGEMVMTHVGSKAVRKLIEERQPLLGLHGHIHESRAFDKIGRTLVINPGSEFNQGILHSTLIIFEGDKVKGHQFIHG